jgi:hypothetical protein
MKFRWLQREEAHESVSLTILIVVTGIITLKLFISGMVIFGFKFSDFDAMDWTTIFTPVAGLYFGQKIQHRKQKESPKVGDQK